VPPERVNVVGVCSNCTAAVRSHHGDDARCPDALPGQPERERVELLTGHRHLCPQIRVDPEEPALVKPPRAQPDADAVVHEDLHAIGPSVGEQAACRAVLDARESTWILTYVANVGNIPTIG
jgi:hypothetical protein